jgi:hypothetical protein
MADGSAAVVATLEQLSTRRTTVPHRGGTRSRLLQGIEHN